MHGGGGVTDDFPLAMAYAHLRTLRLADGPDEVHKRTIARRELRQYRDLRPEGPVTMPTEPTDLTRQDRDRHWRLPRNRVGDGAGTGRRRRQRRLTSRKQEAADEAAAQIAGSAIGVAAHAVDEDQACRCINLALETFGSVDILVNNAGTNPAYGPMIQQDHDRFAKTFDVNLWAPLLWTALATEAWMGEHGGSVINIASIGGLAHEARPRGVQHHQGRADLPDQATGA